MRSTTVRQCLIILMCCVVSEYSGCGYMSKKKFFLHRLCTEPFMYPLAYNDFSQMLLKLNHRIFAHLLYGKSGSFYLR